MRLLRSDDGVLVRYLLGWLPDDEAERLDQASIEDDEVADRLRIVEQDLIDGYVRRTLADETRARFESYFLVSPQRRRRVRAAEAFLRAVDSAAAKMDAEAAHKSRTSFTRTLAFAAAAVVILTTALFVGGAFGTRTTMTSPQQPRAALERSTATGRATGGERGDQRTSANAEWPATRPLTTIARAPSRAETKDAVSPVALVLPPLTRAAETLPTMPAPSVISPVVIELQMDVDEFPQYQIALKDPLANRVLWRGGWSRARIVAGIPSIAIVIPSSLLKPQRYWLDVSGRGDNGVEIISSYVFQVVPR